MLKSPPWTRTALLILPEDWVLELTYPGLIVIQLG
jgi:hypothetical protein